MQAAFEKLSFWNRLKTMLKVDFQRMFTMPLVYIMAGVCFALPILILLMTTTMGGAEEGAETMGMFTNVWQAIGAVSGSGMSMDLASMCNINMLYFLVAVFVCIFVSEDFTSGYAKNLFTVRSKKVDYVIAKSLVTFSGATIMMIMFFVGAMIGGAIANLSFETIGFGAGGIVACLFSKIFITAIFVSLSILLSVVAKQRLWLSILSSCASGMLLYTMIPMIAPLDSNFLNVILCFFGSAIFAVGVGAASNVVLNKTSLV